MMKLHSFLAGMIKDYVAFRQASGRTSFSYVKNVIFFDHHCAKKYPWATKLTQEMVDDWCKQRATEANNSCISRIYPVFNFLRYAKRRGLVDIQIPIAPRPTPRTYIPHTFTKEELQNFFKACDTMETRKGLSGDIRKIIIPVFFRLLYSSGIRTTEARLLRTNDVNLENGIVSIKYSKGHNQHFVVLHNTMLELMRVYDSTISQLIPNRIYFFPTSSNDGYDDCWIRYFFNKLWFQKNKAYATAYELRHHYAVENINKWMGQGLQTHMRLLSLSKSMGHSDIESTKYYYSLVPSLSDIIENTTQKTFNEIIPNITDHEES